MKINDFTFEEKQNALDEAHLIMNPVEEMDAERLRMINLRIGFLLGCMDEKGNGEVSVQSVYNDMTWLAKQAKLKQQFADESILQVKMNTGARTVLFETKAENKRMKKALFVALAHAVESTSDGTTDVITDTLHGLDFTDIWNDDCEKGKKLFEEWTK